LPEIVDSRSDPFSSCNTIPSWHLVKLAVLQKNLFHFIFVPDETRIEGERIVTRFVHNREPCAGPVAETARRLTILFEHPELKLLAVREEFEVALQVTESMTCTLLRIGWPTCKLKSHDAIFLPNDQYHRPPIRDS